jgi:16S rRNA (cytosine1402-N4)-methyltransferase
MVNEVMALLRPAKDALLLDATLGDGGHAKAWLERGGQVVGLDRDPSAVQRARHRLRRWEERLSVYCVAFSQLGDEISAMGRPWAVLFDLGTSRAQIEEPARGFSYLEDGPLDMRMNQSLGDPLSLILRRTTLEELAGWLARYADISRPRTVARAILRKAPLTTTGELAETVGRVFPPRRRIKDTARVFQALRMVVNDEERELQLGMQTAVEMLQPGGRVAALTYHSGEERSVRSLLRRFSGQCICPPGLPVCGCGALELLRPLRPFGARPSDAEMSRNTRSRSARLWAAEKLCDA